MTRPHKAILILLVAIYAAPGAAQSLDAVEELKACAAVTDKEARLACFDALGERVLSEEPANSEPPQAATLQPIPEDFGRTQEVEYAVSITSCRQGGSGTWFFFLENGQVWKEANKRNLRLKECSFDATIRKDGFGYKMAIAEIDKTIRVKRHR